MIASAWVAHYVRNADRWGSAPDAVGVDLPKVVARDRVVGRSRAGLNRKVEERQSLHLYRGHAPFIGPHAVRVGEERLESGRIFVDTGTRPDVPPLEGLRGIDFLDNASIMRLTEVPAHLLGLMKLVVDAETDRILGAAILASEGGEVVQILHAVMLAGAPYTLLKGAVYIHPTLAEGLWTFMEAVTAA